MVPRVWYIAAGFLGYAGLWCLYIVMAWRVCKCSPTTLGGRILENVFVVPLGLQPTRTESRRRDAVVIGRWSGEPLRHT